MFQASKTCSNKNIVGRTKYRTAQICWHTLASRYDSALLLTLPKSWYTFDCNKIHYVSFSRRDAIVDK